MAQKQAQMGVNGEKWLKIKFLRRWQDNGMVIAWSSFFSIENISTAPSVNIFVNKSRGGSRGHLKAGRNRLKWQQMAKIDFTENNAKMG